MLTFDWKVIGSIFLINTPTNKLGATAPTQRNDVNHWVFLSHNFSKEQSMLPEDDRMIETCRSVFGALMWILDHQMNICAFVGVLIK